MKKKLKNIIFAVIAIMFVAIVIEALSFTFFTVFKERFTFFDIEQYLLSDTVIKYAYQRYHPERGWDMQYDTPFGERPRAVSYKKASIATFGDSFTHCDQVQHHETWQEYLASLLERDVYNFGTGGYGTDQAYLKFLEKYPKVKTDIVMLCLITENINRIVNVYRPFYFSRTGQKITKPRFEVLDNTLALLKNPVAHEKDIPKLQNPGFIAEIGQNDFWYNRNNYPVLIFPYSKILFNKHMWLELIYHKKGYQIDDINPRPWENLWEDKEATDIMFKIFESFVETVKAENAIPIIMVIPAKQEVVARLTTGEATENVLKIVEFCRKNNYRYFNPIDGFVEYVNNRDGSARPTLYEGHVTPTGNRIIAERLFQYLNDIYETHAKISNTD